jgi:hypothetical protein
MIVEERISGVVKGRDRIRIRDKVTEVTVALVTERF